MWRRVLSSQLKTLAPRQSLHKSAAAVLVNRPLISPPVSPPLSSRFFSAESGDSSVKKRVEGKDIQEIDYPAGPFRTKATVLHETAIKSFGFQRRGITTSASAQFIKKKDKNVGVLTRFIRFNEAIIWHINQGVENILADYVHHGITRNVMVICFKIMMLIVIKDVFLWLLSL